MAKYSTRNIENFNVVVEALKASNGIVGDDHSNGDGTMKAAGIAALVKGDSIIPVLLCNSRYFSLNLMYVDKNGKPRVARESVGGVVIPQDFDMNLMKAVEGYNANQEGSEFSCGKLEHVHYVMDVHATTSGNAFC